MAATTVQSYVSLRCHVWTNILLLTSHRGDKNNTDRIDWSIKMVSIWLD